MFGIDYALAAAAAFSVLQQHHVDKPQPDLPTVHCNAQMGSDDYIYIYKFFSDTQLKPVSTVISNLGPIRYSIMQLHEFGSSILHLAWHNFVVVFYVFIL